MSGYRNDGSPSPARLVGAQPARPEWWLRSWLMNFALGVLLCVGMFTTIYLYDADKYPLIAAVPLVAFAIAGFCAETHFKKRGIRFRINIVWIIIGYVAPMIVAVVVVHPDLNSVSKAAHQVRHAHK